MKFIWKKVFLLLAVIVLLTGCGKGEGTKEASGNTGEDKPEYVYLPEYYSINEYAEWIGEISKTGNYIYFSTNTWDEETGVSSTKLFQYDISAKSAQELPFVIEGTSKYMQNFWVMEDGSLEAVLSEYKVENESTGEGRNYYYLSRYDAEGQLINEYDITETVMGNSEWGYMQSPQIDSQGNLYFYDGEKSVKGISAEGQPTIKLDLEGYVQSIALTGDGRLFLAYYGNTGTGEMVVKEADVTTGQLSEALENLPVSLNSVELFGGIKENALYIESGSDVYEYDLETKQAVKLFNWLDMDINSDSISTLEQIDENTFCTLMREYSEESQDYQLVFITKTKNEGLPEKKILTMAVSWEDYSVKNAIIKFNRNSDTHRITLKVYNSTGDQISSELLNADIAAGNIPDIIDVGIMDCQSLIKNGVITDLTPLMANDTEVKRDSLVESALTSFSEEDKLYAIPTTFSISTLMGKTSALNGMTSWNLEQYKDFIAQLPEGTEVMSYASKDNVFYMMLNQTLDKFIDWKTGNCSFNSEEFISLLEFANTFPQEINYNEDENLPEKVQSNKMALLDIGISSVEEYQMYLLMFGEPVTCIGFPTESGSGTRLQTNSNAFAITEACTDKEGAWSFIRNFYTMEGQNSRSNWGFPILKDALEKQFEEAMKPEYITLEDGTKEETEKTSWGYDDWEAKIYAATPEQIEELRNLINNAEGVSSGNNAVISILQEEVGAYFEGQKSAQDVANIIQSRVTIYVSENQ